MLEFYSRFVIPNQPCFDVGANIGNRVKVFLSLQARVLAVEPQAECVEVLRKAFGRNNNLTIAETAVGPFDGEVELHVASVDTVSSLSREWIDSVTRTGRFGKVEWSGRRTVPITTLDKLIERYGRPSFIKIDVEGYELEVLKGLSEPVRALSLEFTPEFINSTFECINYLSALGDIRLNYSLREEMTFALDEWVTPNEVCDILSRVTLDRKFFGDVYVESV